MSKENEVIEFTTPVITQPSSEEIQARLAKIRKERQEEEEQKQLVKEQEKVARDELEQMKKSYPGRNYSRLLRIGGEQDE